MTASLFDQMVFLGTGTSHGVPVIGCACAVCRSHDRRNRRLRSSVVVGLPQGNLLIDSTPDMRTQLLREHIGRIHAVAYTHEHADHLFGLDDLRIFPQYLGHDLPVYCSEKVEARIRMVFDYAFNPATQAWPAGGLPKLEFRRLGDEPFEVLGATVVPLSLRHGRQAIHGFRIGAMAYCTDCNHVPEATFERLQGLKLLVIDALRHRPHPTHFSLAESLDIVARVQPERAIFTHICHEVDHESVSAELPPGVELAYDGLRVSGLGLSASTPAVESEAG